MAGGLVASLMAQFLGDSSSLEAAASRSDAAMKKVQEQINKTGLAGQTYNEFLKEQEKQAKKLPPVIENIGKKLLTVATLYKTYDFIKDSINDYVKYADEVNNVSRLIGATTEESSRLIQVSDRVGVTTNILTASMQQAIKKGYEPTIEGLMQMSREYLALADPMERVLYLQERFTTGRAAGGNAGMAPLLELGPERIEAMGQAVKGGLVLSQQEVYQARLTSFMINDLSDTWDTLRFSVGSGIGEVLYSFFALNTTKTRDLLEFAGELKKMGVVGEEFNAQMGEAVRRAGFVLDEYGNLRERTGRMFEGTILAIKPENQPLIAEGFLDLAKAQENAGDSTRYLTNAQKEAIEEERKTDNEIRITAAGILLKNAITSDGISVSEKYKGELNDLMDREMELQAIIDEGTRKSWSERSKKMKEAREELAQVLQAEQDLTVQFRQHVGVSYFDIIMGGAKNATPRIAMMTANALGIMDDKTYGLEAAAYDATDALDGVNDGLIDMGKWSEDTAKKAGIINDVLYDLKGNVPEGWSVDAYYNIFQTTYIRTVYGTGPASTRWADAVGRGQSWLPGGLVHGGSVYGGQHGMVVPPGFANDSMPVMVSSGERLDVTPAGNKSVENDELRTMIAQLNYTLEKLPVTLRDEMQRIM